MFLKGCLIIFGVFFLLTARFGGNTFASEARSVWMQDLPYESWMNAMLMGVKVGYLHIYADRAVYKGENVLRVSSEMFTEIKRFGLSIKNTKTKLFYLRDDLSPCYFLSKSDETGQEKVVEGIVENGVAKVKTTLEGKTTEKQQSLPEGISFAESLEEITLRKGLKVGNQFSLSVFSLDFFDTINVKVNVVGKEKLEYKGQMKDVFAVDYTMDIMGGITTREWLTVDGDVYKMEMSSLGITFLKVDKEDALGSVGQLDLILKTKLDLIGEPPKPNIRSFKVNAFLPDGNIKATFVDNDRQTVTSGDNPSQGTIEVEITDIDESKALQRPIKAVDLTPYLMPSIYIQSDDPDVISKAREIAGDEENAWKTAVKICKWVNENIKDKNYKVGFGTAKQTLKDLQGDCSEHTVLFVGLARALGIPARICTGIVYHRDAFYYHFWPEVYVSQWVGMEPTLGQIQADATHIQFISDPVESESALELGEGVLKTINRLRIERIK